MDRWTLLLQGKGGIESWRALPQALPGVLVAVINQPHTVLHRDAPPLTLPRGLILRSLTALLQRRIRPPVSLACCVGKVGRQNQIGQFVCPVTSSR